MCNESIIKLLLPQTTKTSPGAGANKQQHEQRKQHQHHRLVAHFGATHHQLLLATHPSINQMQTLLPENDSISWMLEQMEGGEGVMGCSTAHWLLSGIYEGS